MKPILTILACMAVLLGLFVSPAAAITINVTAALNNQTDHPSFDPNLVELTGIMQAAANYWEGIILDNHTVDITFGYLDLDPSILGVAQIQANDGQRPTEGAIALDTIVNAGVPFERDWYFDPTPLNNSEFNMQQVLVRDLTAQQTSMYYNGSPPDLLEAGFYGNYSGADLGDDAFSVALHEIGHILGVTNTLPGSAVELADGDYDFNPGFVNNASVAAEIWDLPGDIQPEHLRSPDAMMSVGAGNGDRHLPGATDIFAAAAVAGWNSIDLYRMDYLAGTVWDLGINWEGGTIPDSNDEVYVRHGGDVSVLLDSVAGNLIIRDGSSVNTNDNFLSVSNKVTVETGPGGGSDATLVVEDEGRIIADEIEINDGGNVAISGSMFNSRILADLVDINDGGVLLGHGLVSADALTNDGTITALNPIGDNTMEMRLGPPSGGIDLDGSSGLGTVFAVLGNVNVTAPLTDSFDGEITVGATRYIRFQQSWQLGQNGSSDPAQLRLQGGSSLADAARVTGAAMTANRGQIIVTGFGEIAVPVTFNDDIAVSIAEDTVLVLSQPATFTGGSYTGQGTLRFGANPTISDDTTMNVAFVDLDGTSGSIETTLSNAVLTLNVDAIDAPSALNRFDGTLNVNGLSSRLDVRLNDPGASWQMNGELNLTAIGLPGQADVLLAGSDVLVTGTINAAGSPWITANLDLAGTLNINTAATRLGLLSGTHVIRNTAAVNGFGTLDNLGQSTLFLEHNAAVHVDVFNGGRLELGNSAGAALIDGDFSQSFSGVLAIELGGTLAGSQYDQLVVRNNANLDGTLDVSLIDDFEPLLGNSFTILQTNLGSVGGQFDNEILPIFNGLTFDVVYNAQSVVLQVIEAPLVPGDFDGDGDVDGADFVIWQTNFPTESGATLATGDADGDGDVDGADFVVWQTNFPFTPGGASPVPEPSGAALLTIGLMAVGYLRLRRRVARSPWHVN